jgi:hypothetical protein
MEFEKSAYRHLDEKRPNRRSARQAWPKLINGETAGRYEQLSDRSSSTFPISRKRHKFHVAFAELERRLHSACRKGFEPRFRIHSGHSAWMRKGRRNSCKAAFLGSHL